MSVATKTWQNMSKEALQGVHRDLLKLDREKFEELFLRPVVRVLEPEIAERYRARIQHPMSLSQLGRLYCAKDWPRGRASLDEYLRHVQLIASNCQSFNDGDNDADAGYRRQADELLACATRRIRDERRSIRGKSRSMVQMIRHRSQNAADQDL